MIMVSGNKKTAGDKPAVGLQLNGSKAASSAGGPGGNKSRQTTNR
jgi:hypothetical protein